MKGCHSPISTSQTTPTSPTRSDDKVPVSSSFSTRSTMSTGASTSTTRFTPSIPTEILLSIFRIATGDAVSPDYVPFSRDPTPAGLSVKVAIILVCKRWRAVGAQFLYEDIKITPRRFDSFLEILDRTGEF